MSFVIAYWYERVIVGTWKTKWLGFPKNLSRLVYGDSQNLSFEEMIVTNKSNSIHKNSLNNS